MDLPWLQPGCPVTMLSEQPGCHSPASFSYLFCFSTIIAAIILVFQTILALFSLIPILLLMHCCLFISIHGAQMIKFYKLGFSKYFLNSTCLHQGRSPCVPAGMLPQELAVLLKMLIPNNHNNKCYHPKKDNEHFWKIIIWWISSPRARWQMASGPRWCGWCPQMQRTHGWKIMDMLSCWFHKGR